ncbi:hypothetical protein NL676_020713 [Syzygium grande]|nr:hypothetical protein NL676_020713 [Syzygium grande]
MLEGEAANTLAKEAKRNESILSSTAAVKTSKSSRLASACSKRGHKGINQDCFILWEEFGCQEDMTFCGVFDGHGPWGHVVAKRVGELLPSFLLCKWQEALSLGSQDWNANLQDFDIWKQSFLKTYAAVDQELKLHRSIDTFFSGTTASTIVKQGENLLIANIGDSRAVLATTSDNGSLVPLQLTIDFKPNLPQEAERIKQSKGRVYCLPDEPGLYRVWRPNDKTPGLAVSRAFGDFCLKDFGLISVPYVTQRKITGRDQFIILASDGVWDVISNHEAVQIVSSAPDREKSAKTLVECAARAWKLKRRGIAMDDISAICLFFHKMVAAGFDRPLRAPTVEVGVKIRKHRGVDG